VTGPEQTFFLRVARGLVGKHGLALSFERVRGPRWRIEAGSPYGPCATVVVTLESGFCGKTERGGFVCTNDVVQNLRAQLRRMARA